MKTRLEQNVEILRVAKGKLHKDKESPLTILDWVYQRTGSDPSSDSFRFVIKDLKDFMSADFESWMKKKEEEIKDMWGEEKEALMKIMSIIVELASLCGFERALRRLHFEFNDIKDPIEMIPIILGDARHNCFFDTLTKSVEDFYVNPKRMHTLKCWASTGEAPRIIFSISTFLDLLRKEVGIVNIIDCVRMEFEESEFFKEFKARDIGYVNELVGQFLGRIKQFSIASSMINVGKKALECSGFGSLSEKFIQSYTEHIWK